MDGRPKLVVEVGARRMTSRVLTARASLRQILHRVDNGADSWLLSHIHRIQPFPLCSSFPSARNGRVSYTVRYSQQPKCLGASYTALVSGYSSQVCKHDIRQPPVSTDKHSVSVAAVILTSRNSHGPHLHRHRPPRLGLLHIALAIIESSTSKQTYPCLVRTAQALFQSDWQLCLVPAVRGLPWRRQTILFHVAQCGLLDELCGRH